MVQPAQALLQERHQLVLHLKVHSVGLLTQQCEPAHILKGVSQALLTPEMQGFSAGLGAEGGVVAGVGGSAKRQHRGQLKAPFCCLIGIAVALEAQKQLAVVPGREGIIGQGH